VVNGERIGGTHEVFAVGRLDQILHPMIKPNLQAMKPTNINFFVGEKDAEGLERKFMDYVKKSNEL